VKEGDKRGPFPTLLRNSAVAETLSIATAEPIHVGLSVFEVEVGSFQRRCQRRL
jgi:hypothetical protein